MANCNELAALSSLAGCNGQPCNCCCQGTACAGGVRGWCALPNHRLLLAHEGRSIGCTHPPLCPCCSMPAHLCAFEPAIHIVCLGRIQQLHPEYIAAFVSIAPEMAGQGAAKRQQQLLHRSTAKPCGLCFSGLGAIVLTSKILAGIPAGVTMGEQALGVRSCASRSEFGCF